VLVDRVGHRTERKLVVDEGRGMLVIFSRRDVMLRQLPLTQLVQVSPDCVMV
jgi:hypothetical protein